MKNEPALPHLYPTLHCYFFNNPNFKRNKHLLSTNPDAPLYCLKSQKLTPSFISLDATIYSIANSLIQFPFPGL